MLAVSLEYLSMTIINSQSLRQVSGVKVVVVATKESKMRRAGRLLAPLKAGKCRA